VYTVAQSQAVQMVAKYERERTLVELLMRRRGLTAECYIDPKKEAGDETGADVVALIDGRRIGIQVTELDTGDIPGRARASEKADWGSAQAQGHSTYGTWAQNDPSKMVAAVARAVTAKVQQIVGCDEAWLLISASVPELGTLTSTFVLTQWLPAGVGELELASLQGLRERVKSSGGPPGRLKASVVTGDVRQMHQTPEYAGALFQVASQFNLLEMVSPSVTPEDGVTRYRNDPTQGPACAIAAGAATIYRNYFAPVGGGYGQTTDRQFDGLAEVGDALRSALNKPVKDLWKMQNGYARCTRAGLDAIAKHLGKQKPEQIDILRAKLRIGIQSDVEVTDATKEPRPFVSQAFCSALPVAYTDVPSALWELFAILVLEAAYEATMWAAVLNARRGKSSTVLLTFLGGSSFGNEDIWIYGAIRRALEMMSGFALDVRLVSYREPSQDILRIAEDFH
jgi:hypothetical protein